MSPNALKAAKAVERKKDAAYARMKLPFLCSATSPLHTIDMYSFGHRSLRCRQLNPQGKVIQHYVASSG